VLSDIENSYMSSGIEEHEVVLPKELSLFVPPKPAYKPSPEIQQQSDMTWAAFLLEGSRRKDQGLPPDRDAQARAAADAMAWAEDNPMSP
jgi:hypothetical protein